MATLLYESDLNAALENIINSAERYVLFLCPYFQLHDRLKDCLKKHFHNPDVGIIIIFGKNDDNPSKSLNRNDFEFLKSFPNVTIAYEKRLHAKYYANEKEGLVTSLNLHTFSLNNNIELGVHFCHKNVLKNLTGALNPLTSILAETENIASEGDTFFDQVLSNSEAIFKKEPSFESAYLGFSRKYVGSAISLDISSDFFGQSNNYYENRGEYRPNSNTQRQFNKQGFDQQSIRNKNVDAGPNIPRFSNHSQSNRSQLGYCIRTGDEINFDPTSPLSRQAYHKWSEFGNINYREKYCHRCGKGGSTSVRRPLCNDCS